MFVGLCVQLQLLVTDGQDFPKLESVKDKNVLTCRNKGQQFENDRSLNLPIELICVLNILNSFGIICVPGITESCSEIISFVPFPRSTTTKE